MKQQLIQKMTLTKKDIQILRKYLAQDTIKIVRHIVKEELEGVKTEIRRVLVEQKKLKTTPLQENTRPVIPGQKIKSPVVFQQQKSLNPADAFINGLGLNEFNPDLQEDPEVAQLNGILTEDYSKFINAENNVNHKMLDAMSGLL